jgi:hypothetical protein
MPLINGLTILSAKYRMNGSRKAVSVFAVLFLMFTILFFAGRRGDITSSVKKENWICKGCYCGAVDEKTHKEYMVLTEGGHVVYFLKE